MTPNPKQRCQIFDELRGLAIIGVIAIHAASHDAEKVVTTAQYWVLVIQTLLGRFAVPSFLIISGFFVSYKERVCGEFSVRNMMIGRIQRVFPPYLIWSGIFFLLMFLGGNGFSRHPVVIFVGRLLTGTNYFHLYFIVLIIQMYLLTYFGFMRNGRASRVTVMMAAAAFLVCTLPSYWITIDGSALDGSAAGYYFRAYERSLFPRWLPFFMLGRWLGARWEEVNGLVAQHRGVVSLLLMSSLVLCLLDFLFLRWLRNGECLLPPDWMVSCALFGSSFTIWFLTIQRRAGAVRGVMARLGLVSFGVYLLHEPALTLLMRWFAGPQGGGASSLIYRQAVSILAGLVVSLIMVRIIQGVLPEKFKRYVLG